jgi:ABC-type branched-subunit amino acid transport system substrate-binding protein
VPGELTSVANQAATPEQVVAAKAAAAKVNAAGGVNGHPIQIDSCDTRYDQAATAACARKAKSNGDVAVVGAVTSNGDAMNPILVSEGIANIGQFPISPSDYSSKTNFPIVAGTPALIAGAARALANAGAKRITSLYVDIPSGAIATTFVSAGLSGTQAKVTNKVAMPTTATDVTQYVAAAARNSDGVVIAVFPQQTVPVVKAFKQQGLTTKLSAPSLQPALLGQLGASADGVLTANQFAPLTSDLAGVHEFLDGMKAAAPNASLNDFALSGWTGVMTFAAAMKQQNVTDITAATVLAALPKVSNLDLGGIVHEISFTTPNPAPGLGRIFNPYIQYGVLRGGSNHAIDGKWVNPLAP